MYRGFQYKFQFGRGLVGARREACQAGINSPNGYLEPTGGHKLTLMPSVPL